MKNITFSADEDLIRRAREKVKGNKESLNREFRNWLRRFVGRTGARQYYDSMMSNLSYAKPGRHISRDELNER